MEVAAGAEGTACCSSPGGGAMLHGLDELIRQKTGVSVNLSEQAQDAVALGVGRAATDERLLDKLLDAASAGNKPKRRRMAC